MIRLQPLTRDRLTVADFQYFIGWQMRIVESVSGRIFQGLIRDILSHPTEKGEAIVIIFAWILEDLGNRQWTPGLEDSGEPIGHWVGTFEPWERLERTGKGEALIYNSALNQTIVFFSPESQGFELATRTHALLLIESVPV